MEFMTESRGGGYHCAQVDAYIGEMRQAYQQMYDAHMALLHQQEDLQMRLHHQQMELGACYAQKEAMAQALIQAQRMAAGYPQQGNMQMPSQQYPVPQVMQQMTQQMPSQPMQQQMPSQNPFAPQPGAPMPAPLPKDDAPESYRNPYMPPYDG